MRDENLLLVTGSSGLLGEAIIQAAARAGLTCLAADLEPTENLPCEQVRLDLRDPAGIADLFRSRVITRVIHSGAISHPRLASASPQALWAVNASGTVALLDALRGQQATRFVFISSVAIYGPREGPLTEDAPPRPAELYGASKAAAEAMVTGYASAFGLPAVILRPVSIYGARRRTFSVPAAMLAAAIDDVPLTIADAGGRIDFIDVRDVARAALLALECPAGPDAIFNVATGRKSSYREVADIVRALHPQARIDLPRGRADLGVEPALDTFRARERLGFSAEIALEDGIAELDRALRADPALRRAALNAQADLA